LSALLDILYLARTNRNSVNLRYKDKASFGALYFIDTMCWQIAKHRPWKLNHNLPAKEAKILSNLKSLNPNKTESEDAYIINTKVEINREENPLAEQEHKQRSKEIRDMIIKGIREHQPEYELTHPQHTAIDSAISEHFDNILLHVPKALYGFCVAFLIKRRKKLPY
jgi:hypothetical protein